MREWGNRSGEKGKKKLGLKWVVGIEQKNQGLGFSLPNGYAMDWKMSQKFKKKRSEISNWMGP